MRMIRTVLATLSLAACSNDHQTSNVVAEGNSTTLQKFEIGGQIISCSNSNATIIYKFNAPTGGAPRPNTVTLELNGERLVSQGINLADQFNRARIEFGNDGLLLSTVSDVNFETREGVITAKIIDTSNSQEMPMTEGKVLCTTKSYIGRPIP